MLDDMGVPESHRLVYTLVLKIRERGKSQGFVTDEQNEKFLVGYLVAFLYLLSCDDEKIQEEIKKLLDTL